MTIPGYEPGWVSFVQSTHLQPDEKLKMKMRGNSNFYVHIHLSHSSIDFQSDYIYLQRATAK